MSANVLVVVGLDDATAKYEERMDVWRALGINAELYAFGWQKRDASLEKLQDRLLCRVDELSTEGDIDLVGLSAGGIAVAWTLQQRPDVIRQAINVAGAMSLPREGNFNRFFSRKHETLFDEMLRGLKPNEVTDERLISIRPPYDGIVRRSAVKFGKARIINSVVPLHPLAITHELRRRVPKLLLAA